MEEANRVAPTFARVFKEMIIVTDSKKPLPRAAKGTIIRHQALQLYAEEIENLCVSLISRHGFVVTQTHLNRYQTIADSADSKGIAPPTSWEQPDILRWLLDHCQSIRNSEKPILVEQSIFEQGFDR